MIIKLLICMWECAGACVCACVCVFVCVRRRLAIVRARAVGVIGWTMGVTVLPPRSAYATGVPVTEPGRGDGQWQGDGLEAI